MQHAGEIYRCPTCRCWWPSHALALKCCQPDPEPEPGETPPSQEKHP